MLVVEEDRRAGFEAPAGFTETQRRSYGDTELVFLKFAGVRLRSADRAGLWA